jgi:hypothetical protein
VTADEATDLAPGDEVTTDFHGEPRRKVKVVAIVRGGHRTHGKGHSQTGTLIRVHPPLHKAPRISGMAHADFHWYDVGWFERARQTALF